MNSQYIDQDTLDEIRNAYGMGVSLKTLAAQLGTTEDALRRLMGLPEWQPEPELKKSLDWTR